MPITNPDPYELDGVAIDTTEISVVSGTSALQTVTSDGLKQLLLDPVGAAMALGDSVRWRVYEKVLSGGTKRVVMTGLLSHAQSQAIVTPPLLLLHGHDWTLQKEAGTTRNWDASIREITGTISEPHTLSAVTVGTTPISVPSGTTALSTRTEMGVYQLFIDPLVDPLVAADIFIVRAWDKVEATSGAKQIVYELPIIGVQLENLVTPLLTLKNGWDWTIHKEAGTDRGFTVSLRKAA